MIVKPIVTSDNATPGPLDNATSEALTIYDLPSLLVEAVVGVKQHRLIGIDTLDDLFDLDTCSEQVWVNCENKKVRKNLVKLVTTDVCGMYTIFLANNNTQKQMLLDKV